MRKTIKRRKLTPPEYAQRLGVSPNKVVGFILSGELKATNMASRRDGRPRYLIDESDIERFERSREVITTPKSTTTRLRRKANPGITEFF